VYPNGGFADRPWMDDRDEDALARIARGVCEVYSQALPALRLQARASLLRLNGMMSEADPEFTGSRSRPSFAAPPSAAVEVSARYIDSFEFGWLWVPVGFADQPLDRQRAWALAAIHEAARQLAQARGWDDTVLDAARRHAEDRDLRFTAEGPWKSAPDRRHRARGTVGIGDNGIGHARLEVTTSDGEPVDRTEPVEASCDGQDLIWTCKSVKWDGASRVTMVAIMDPYGMRQRQLEVRLGAQPAGTATRRVERAVRFHPPRRPSA